MKLNVSIPENGVIPFEVYGLLVGLTNRIYVSIPENGVIPFEEYAASEIQAILKVSIPENGVIPFEGYIFSADNTAGFVFQSPRMG